MADLDLLPSGPIPPNPNELLYGHRLEELISELSSRYDYIVIDTAPVGMVSDTMLIRRVTDVMLFVVRAGYTAKNRLPCSIRWFRPGVSLPRIWLSME